MRRPALGVRRSVVLAAGLALAIALLTGALILRTQLHDALERAIGVQTLTRARGVAALVQTGDFSRTLQPDDRTPAWVQVIEGDKILASTPNIANLTTPFASVPTGSPATLRRLGGLSIDTGERVAVASVPSTVGGRPVVVLAASPLDLVDATDQRIVALLAVVFPSLLLIGCAVVWTAARRSLRPVEAIRAQVASITGADTSRRVPVPHTDDEISNLATTMNDMLERLDAAATRQRRFIADASHELRSPLASLRNQLEACAFDDTRESWAASIADMSIDHDRLERLVTDLLLLARHDEGERLALEPVDLGYLVRNELARRPTPPDIERRVDASNVLINANPDAIIRVVRNLVDNAERHATTRVGIHLVITAEKAELVVSDDGPGIPATQHHAVFERFVRLDEARSADAGGSGLGLAIVAELVAQHHATIEITPTTTGAQFVARFPRLLP